MLHYAMGEILVKCTNWSALITLQFVQSAVPIVLPSCMSFLVSSAQTPGQFGSASKSHIVSCQSSCRMFKPETLILLT